MEVKLLTSLSGPGRNHSYGEVVDMEDAEAVRFIEREMAVPVMPEKGENGKAKNADKETRSQKPTDPPQGVPDVIDLNELTKAQLITHAAEFHGIELDQKLKKEELIAAINAHLENAAENTPD